MTSYGGSSLGQPKEWMDEEPSREGIISPDGEYVSIYAPGYGYRWVSRSREQDFRRMFAEWSETPSAATNTSNTRSTLNPTSRSSRSTLGSSRYGDRYSSRQGHGPRESYVPYDYDASSARNSSARSYTPSGGVMPGSSRSSLSQSTYGGAPQRGLLPMYGNSGMSSGARFGGGMSSGWQGTGRSGGSNGGMGAGNGGSAQMGRQTDGGAGGAGGRGNSQSGYGGMWPGGMGAFAYGGADPWDYSWRHAPRR